MVPHLLGAAASLALIGASIAGAEGTRSVDAIPTMRTAIGLGEGGGAAPMNKVTISRGGWITRASAAPSPLGCTINVPASDKRTDQQLLDWAKSQGQCQDLSLGQKVGGKFVSTELLGGGVGLVGTVVYAVSSSNSA